MAVLGAAALVAMSVLAAVGAFNGNAAALTASDNFYRANGGLGSSWTTVSGTAAPQIVSDILRVGTPSAVNSAYWSASTFGNDQFAQATMPDSSGTQYGPGIAVRLGPDTRAISCGTGTRRIPCRCGK